MDDLKFLNTVLDALLLWEEMEPKTAAKTVRNRAIEEVQSKIHQLTRDLPKPEAS